MSIVQTSVSKLSILHRKLPINRIFIAQHSNFSYRIHLKDEKITIKIAFGVADDIISCNKTFNLFSYLIIFQTLYMNFSVPSLTIVRHNRTYVDLLGRNSNTSMGKRSTERSYGCLRKIYILNTCIDIIINVI